MPTPIQAADSRVEIRSINGPIYRVTHSGSFTTNMVISSGDDGIFMVDHFNTSANLVLKAIREISSAPIKFAVNTHWHPDHTNGNVRFDLRTTTLAHSQTRARRSAAQSAPWAPSGIPALLASALPDIIFEDEMTLYFNGEAIRLVPLPTGHTDSDILILFTGSKIAVTGDAFNGRGRISGYDWISGNPRNYLNEIERLIELIPEDFDIITGHGDSARLSDVRKYRQLYEMLIRDLDSRLKDGLSPKQAAGLGFPAAWRSWLLPDEFINGGEWLLHTARYLSRHPQAKSEYK